MRAAGMGTRRGPLWPCAAILFFGVFLYGQTAMVSGTITRRNGEAAVNITVTIGGRHRLTDVRGRYRLPDVPYGRQTLEISEGKRILFRTSIEVKGPSVVHNEKLP